MRHDRPALPRNTLRHCIDTHFDEQARALAELMRWPCDNLPGDCAPYAELTACAA